MGRRLKQIKRQDLGDSAKKVIDSLIANTTKEHKEEKKESMRCKIEIFIGSTKRELIDSYIENTNSLDNLIDKIVKKYGVEVQFIITNLYDEKVVSKRLVYIDGAKKDTTDREYFNSNMAKIKIILKLKEEGKTEQEIMEKTSNIFARSYLKEILSKTEAEIIQSLRDRYSNQSLGKYSQQDIILSEDLNTKKDILVNSNLEGENNDE